MIRTGSHEALEVLTQPYGLRNPRLETASVFEEGGRRKDGVPERHLRPVSKDLLELE